MSNLTKGLILVIAILAIGAGLVVWKNRTHASESFNSISRPEIEMLLADVAKSNPMVLKRLAEDPELKKQQVENLKQLLAFASQAKKDGLADTPTNRQELESIKAEILAVNYDREINKDKGPMPPFGFISEEQVKAYWGDESQPAQRGFFDNLKEKIGLSGTAESRTHEAEFNDFLNAKIEVLKASSPDMKDREITEDEKSQARDIFAKIRIYKAEYDQKVKNGELPKEFVDKANLQVKLQQAQFLARLFSEHIAEKLKVTDEEVAKYIAEHPDLDPGQKRSKAQGVLDRAKGGEDFAALANEFSEDPGNKGPDGATQGGMYKDVPKGRMVAPFETAALALEPGQVAPELVETDFGFHIVKLERKLEPNAKKEETYDVRHILFSTGFKDPENPMAREMPLKDYVKAKLETEKEKKLIEEIVAANHVQVPEDFTVPAISDEQIQQMRQKQQQMQMPPEMQPGAEPDGPDAPPAAGEKPAPKKPAGK
ncbi:MAG: peptidylprolyl isomerase [Pyrinomonadaceae bacterium]